MHEQFVDMKKIGQKRDRNKKASSIHFKFQRVFACTIKKQVSRLRYQRWENSFLDRHIRNVFKQRGKHAQ